MRDTRFCFSSKEHSERLPHPRFDRMRSARSKCLLRFLLIFGALFSCRLLVERSRVEKVAAGRHVAMFILVEKADI